MTDRTPIILAALDDLLRERVESRPNDADLLALADGVALAVDHGEAARLWPPTRDDAAHAEWIDLVLSMSHDDGCPSPPKARHDECSAARRLADVAASLPVRSDDMRREAEALWNAASRLLDSESAFAVAYDSAKRDMEEVSRHLEVA